MCLLDKEPENKNKIILNNNYYLLFCIDYLLHKIHSQFSETVNLLIKFRIFTNKSESSFS